MWITTRLWQVAGVVFTPKSGKESYTHPKSYWPIRIGYLQFASTRIDVTPDRTGICLLSIKMKKVEITNPNFWEHC